MSEPVTLCARYVFPVTGPPIHGGKVLVHAGRIVDVGTAHRTLRDVALEDVAVLPGLVNAHSHLEFSRLSRPLAAPAGEFAQWIRQAVHYRREQQRADSGQPPRYDTRQTALRMGLAECVRHGATHVGEIAAPDAPPADRNIYASHQAGVTVFQELLGLSVDGVSDRLAFARDFLRDPMWSKGPARPGLSPHAPYTVHRELLAGVTQLSSDAKVPLAMHLAESLDEIELLAAHSGSLVELLTELDAWDPAAIPRGIRPLDYLRQLSHAHRSLVIHGNFLSSEEMEYLAAQRGHMSLVYCPRTHAYFGHGDYPLGASVAVGVNVCLGTDSRASNPDLSVWAEMQHVAHHHADVAPAAIVEMATMAGARALGLEAEIGSIDVGKSADLTLIKIPHRPTNDPYELLMDPAAKVEAVYVRGQPVTSPVE
jgi:cytosine/adenosine deaminase-related metal-dependent hydrolase